ncbi:MAG TPA: sulfite exporter TauE/SafE family protein [Candidatus Methanomethylophilaceae archaeon]|nr:sulfite exporter TauE/SafE family protein [Candidatus Methanomethylophilaceae archaeon]
MDPVLMTSLILVGLLAGVMGAIFGIGGGIIIVPILTIIYGLTTKDAAAISLVGIVATSVGASSVYIRKRIANIRLGLFLEITTVIGAIIGVLIASHISNFALTIVFAIVLVISGYRMLANPERSIEPVEEEGRRISEYYDEVNDETVRYEVKNLGTGAAASTLAGTISSMTGMGGGTIKIPIMNMHMGVPIKAATATSNYMISITAFTGAILYFVMGDVDLMFAGAIAVGGFVGSVLGTKLASYIDGGPLKRYFSVLLFFIAVIMVLEVGGYL